MERTRHQLLKIHGIDNSVSKSLALIMNDPDATGGKGFVHWLVWNLELVSVLPEKIPKIPEVTFPISALQGVNSFGTIGYAGPCPLTGHLHRYDFKVYGIDTNLNLAAGSGKDELGKTMTGHCGPIMRGLRSVRPVVLFPCCIIDHIMKFWNIICHKTA